VPKLAPESAVKKPTIPDLRTELAARIIAHAPSSGQNYSAMPSLTLFRMTAPTACYLTSVEPSVSIFVQGKKRIDIGGEEHLCDGTSFIVASLDLPIRSQIIEASEAKPQLAMRLLLDMQMVREVVSRDDLAELAASVRPSGLAVGKSTIGLLSASLRLIDLLDTTEDIPFLQHLIEREIIYRILRTPQGQRLREIATSGNLTQRTAKAITWLSENYDKPLRMESLADIARMGVSTLHHQFRALTAMSPLQFQKQLRLRAARERMLNDGLDATSAAYEVGYESVSQFNREYSRFFGQPPLRDIRSLRESNILKTDAA
jgi:AraC-like DNA-binding protein